MGQALKGFHHYGKHKRDSDHGMENHTTIHIAGKGHIALGVLLDMLRQNIVYNNS